MKKNVSALDDIIAKEFKVLDKGFVKLVDYMGDDSSIVEAARVSYGDGTKTVNQDRGLIRYLMRHYHSTPFEMCEIKFHIKCPIFIARQWMRHRTANINEISARYSIIKDEFYVPPIENICKQSKINNQGSGERIADDLSQKIIHKIESTSRDSFDEYGILINEDELSRELSRMVLPQNTYTEFYWKIDLHNLMHFLRLRADKHAQKEIQLYAKVMLEIMKTWAPITHEAFCDYRMNSVNFSGNDISVLIDLLNGDKIAKFIESNKETKNGDTRELLQKLKLIMSIKD
jgi:thymidylate synthase (FAD)